MKKVLLIILIGLFALVGICTTCTAAIVIFSDSEEPSTQSAETATPEEPPAPTQELNNTVTPISQTESSLGVSRLQVYEALQGIEVGFMPLNTHQPEWVSTMLPDGAMSVDIFGLPQDVVGVELWFRVSVSPEDIISTVGALLQASVPGHIEEGMEWFSENMTQIGAEQMVAEQAGTERNIERRGELPSAYLTLISVPEINQVFFSIDAERDAW